MTTQMSTRIRLVVFAVVFVLAGGGALFYVLHVHRRQADAAATQPKVPVIKDVNAVQREPHLVFRNTALGAGYGQVALVPLSDPGGARAITPARCDRVYATGATGICLVAQRGIATTYKAEVMGPQWTSLRDSPLPGLPSRARLSRDGMLLATTTFVYGDAYTNPGQFSTRTIIGPATGGGTELDLETFTLVVDGRQITAADRNLWGVTFADDDHFYATAASGKKTWLVEGSVSARKLTALREDVECPSLSPDGTRIAFKRHGDLSPGKWRLAVYDLRTHTETLLAETRSVDDQAEWLDNSTVTYGLARQAAGSASSDIWTVPADGSGTPRVLVQDAWSPAVIRKP